MFAFVGPDAVVLGCTRRILDALAAAGFRIERWDAADLPPETFDVVIGRELAAGDDLYRYRIMDRLLALAPSVGLMLGSDRPDAYAALKELKGARDPADAAPGSIRADLPAVNSMVNLFHAADSPDRSELEGGAFFPDLAAGGGRDPAELPAFLGRLDAAYDERRGWAEVVTQLRARLELQRDVDGVLAPEREMLLAESWLPEEGVSYSRLSRALAGLDPDPWRDVVLLSSKYFAPRR